MKDEKQKLHQHGQTKDIGNKSRIFSVCAPPQLSGRILFDYLHPPDARVIFLHDDVLCNGTCSVTGGAERTGGHKRKIFQKSNLFCLYFHKNTDIFSHLGVPLDKLQKRILQLMVLDYDKFSRDDPIGEVNIPMCELDFTQPINLWKDLNPIAKEKYKRGEILLSLCYNPVGGIMTIIVVRCKELKPMDISGTSGQEHQEYQVNNMHP